MNQHRQSVGCARHTILPRIGRLLVCGAHPTWLYCIERFAGRTSEDSVDHRHDGKDQQRPAAAEPEAQCGQEAAGDAAPPGPAPRQALNNEGQEQAQRHDQANCQRMSVAAVDEKEQDGRQAGQSRGAGEAGPGQMPAGKLGQRESGQDDDEGAEPRMVVPLREKAGDVGGRSARHGERVSQKRPAGRKRRGIRQDRVEGIVEQVRLYDQPQVKEAQRKKGQAGMQQTRSNGDHPLLFPLPFCRFPCGSHSHVLPYRVQAWLRERSHGTRLLLLVPLCRFPSGPTVMLLSIAHQHGYAAVATVPGIRLLLLPVSLRGLPSCSHVSRRLLGDVAKTLNCASSRMPLRAHYKRAHSRSCHGSDGAALGVAPVIGIVGVTEGWARAARASRDGRAGSGPVTSSGTLYVSSRES
jgi:hypothetical protein